MWRPLISISRLLCRPPMGHQCNARPFSKSHVNQFKFRGTEYEWDNVSSMGWCLLVSQRAKNFYLLDTKINAWIIVFSWCQSHPSVSAAGRCNASNGKRVYSSNWKRKLFSSRWIFRKSNCLIMKQHEEREN